MRIGIEAQRIFRKDKHGMDYVVLQEIKEIQKMDSENDYFVFVAPGDDPCLEETQNVHIILINCPTYPLWEQWALPRMARKLKLDLLHCTSNTAPIWCHIPLVLTLHDIIFLEPRDASSLSIYQNLGWWYRRLVVPRIIHKCRRIITVSDFERRNILSKLHLPEQQIIRIHNGYNEEFCLSSSTDETYRKYIDEPGYFFHFANADARKNTRRTLMAYSQYLLDSDIERQLLMTGITSEQLDALITDLHLEDIRGKIKLTGYISGEDLPGIYRSSFALIFASLREGFGIPLLEAMACGIPVITSNTSSMPEIAGNDAILIHPEKPEEIAKMLLKLENDRSFYQQQVALGLERVKHFSWRQTTQQLLVLYRQVLSEGSNL